MLNISEYMTNEKDQIIKNFKNGKAKILSPNLLIKICNAQK